MRNIVPANMKGIWGTERDLVARLGELSKNSWHPRTEPRLRGIAFEARLFEGIAPADVSHVYVENHLDEEAMPAASELETLCDKRGDWADMSLRRMAGRSGKRMPWTANSVRCSSGDYRCSTCLQGAGLSNVPPAFRTRPRASRRSRLSHTASQSNDKDCANSAERTSGSPAPVIPRRESHKARF
jgi:hypothetical protein